jgi:hypothetical protein
MNTEEMVRAALANPLVMIASDGRITDGKGHPRGAGTYARVLGKYVREEKVLSLTEAIRKSSLMPAKRLESMSSQMRQKAVSKSALTPTSQSSILRGLSIRRLTKTRRNTPRASNT